LATPSTCTQFLPRSAEFALDRLPPAYRTLELCADGSIVTDVVWVESGAGAGTKSAWAAA
ncbi:MAG: 3',5'-cyclic-AMP phosphodiesterase, partial [Steroidobacteraceae bacterium]